MLHDPPRGEDRFPRGRPFVLEPLEEGLLSEALQPTLLAATADVSELEPIRAVSLEGGT